MENEPVTSDVAQSTTPVNKHASITQVANGFILYANSDTKVAYTFEELVEHLKTYFANQGQ